MSEERVWTGGCLCGDVRYEARGRPLYMGHCYCADCRKASGGGYIGFLAFRADQLSLSGEMTSYASVAAGGGEAVRSRCARCGSLVLGGRPGAEDVYNLYAGSLDDPARFEPKVAIFTRGRPAWAAVPEHLIAFEGMPPQG
jgi:hypothetical protein